MSDSVVFEPQIELFLFLTSRLFYMLSASTIVSIFSEYFKFIFKTCSWLIFRHPSKDITVCIIANFFGHDRCYHEISNKILYIYILSILVYSVSHTKKNR